jgi:nucleoside-diphosphate-sugar epimerase
MRKDSDSSSPRILITGGAGLLGRQVIRFFIKQGLEIRLIAVDRKPTTEKCPGVEWICGDLCDPGLWEQLPSDLTHVIHLAALIPWRPEEKNKAEVIEKNVMPVALLAEHGKGWPCLKQVIFSSSVSVYGRTKGILKMDSPVGPSDLYAVSKWAGESILQTMAEGGVDVTALRFTSLYGPGQYSGTVLPIMIRRAIAGEEIQVYGRGTRTQDFLHCQDAARAIWLSYERGVSGVFPLGSGIPTTMKELAHTVLRVFGGPSSQVILCPEKEDGDTGIQVDISEAKKTFGYQPFFSLESGLEDLKSALMNNKS